MSMDCVWVCVHACVSVFDCSWICVAVLQVSQYTFAMCSYREKKAEPQELMQLEGYTVDSCEPRPGRHEKEMLKTIAR